MSSEQYSGYFRCGGCGRFVGNEAMQKHYETNHKEGIAVESPPAPATVSNPPAPQMLYGHAVPPRMAEPKQESVAFNIVFMYRAYPRAFKLWTFLVFAVTAMFISTLYTWIVFHI